MYTIPPTLKTMPHNPFLKWAGGKHKLVPFLTAHLPQQRSGRLIEPFAGSAALTLATDYDAYLINDTNPDLITLYATLKQEKQGFIDYARSYFTPDNNTEARYYVLREQFNHNSDPTERAALFIYLNRHAFNGLCRYNSKGGYNVPFGRYRAPYFLEKEMQAYLGKAGRIQLSCGDFHDVLVQATDDDTIYCDPPYVPLSDTASFTAYHKGGFGADDQQRLVNDVRALASNTRGILISNHDTAYTRALYHDARIETVHVQRNIAASGASRQKVGEILAIYAP